jgi:hypothetical protein
MNREGVTSDWQAKMSSSTSDILIIMRRSAAPAGDKVTDGFAAASSRDHREPAGGAQSQQRGRAGSRP